MGTLTLAVTGATGYLGRAVVAEARAQGHSILVLVRDVHRAPDEWVQDPGIALLEGPLEQLTSATLEGVDAVLHLAAAMVGDDAVQERETLGPTCALLAAIAGCEPSPRLVLASSMSVYGGMREGDMVTESTPREPAPKRRDAYTRAKLAQEALTYAHAARTSSAAAILRIGAIWGPGRLWNGHLGVALGPLLIRMGSGGQIPLTHREHAASLLVRAAEVPLTGVQVANVLDTDLPDRDRYVDALRQSGWPRFVFTLGWPLMRALSVLGALPGMPGLLRSPVQCSRIMPLRYASEAVWLGGLPSQSFKKAMSAAVTVEGESRG